MSGLGARVVGLVRLVHPFPTTLVALTTGALVAIAGGDPGAVLRSVVAMAGIQSGIGALNDLVDRGRDTARPGKPVAAGLVSVALARTIAVAGFSLGVGLSAIGGPATALVAAAGAACGIVYDLRLVRTTWSWLPLAVALPLVPVYAWLVATGSVPPEVLRLGPAAIMAGAGLAIANAVADRSLDLAHGPGGIATRTSTVRSRLVSAGLLVVALILTRPSGPATAELVTGLWLAGVLAVMLGSAAAARGGRGWELQAIGIAMAGASALLSIVGSPS